MSQRNSITVHLRSAGVPVIAEQTEENQFSFFDYERRFEFLVSVGELTGLGTRWSVTISADAEDDESLAGLMRLPNLPTSRRDGTAYVRWSPFTADSAADAPRRISDWVVGTIANAAERLRLSKTPPAEEVAVGDEVAADVSVPAHHIAALPADGTTQFGELEIRELLKAIAGAADPRLAAFEALGRMGLISASLKEEIQGEIGLERGDVESVLAAAVQGKSLTPQQAQILVQAALTTHSVDEAILAQALELTQAAWDRQARMRILDRIREHKSHRLALSRLNMVAQLVPVEFAVELGITLLDLVNVTDAGLNEKKLMHLEAIRSMLGAGTPEAVAVASHALELGKIRPFDVWSDKVLNETFKGQIPAVDLVYRTTLKDATEPDLRAAGAALMTLEGGPQRTKLLSRWLKRWQEAGYPLNDTSLPIMKAIVGALALVHGTLPSSEEAQRDALSIQRLAAENPRVATFAEAHAAIDAARKPGSAAAAKEREEAQRFERASGYIKEHIAGKKRRIIVVGGRPSLTTVETVNEFHEPDDDGWLEWLMASKDEIINRRNITTKIRGDSCVALVLLTGAMGHARSKLARETGKAANRVIVEVRSTSREDVRRALFEVTEKLAKGS